MASSLKASNILIFGATGFIGTYITEKIITAQPAFNRVTIFTSPETAASKSDLLAGWQKQAGGHVSVVTGSVDSEADVKAAYREYRIDTVVCALGRGAIAKQIALLRWADEGDDVRWFLPSEYGTDVEYYGEAGRDEKPHQQKLRVRAFVRDGGVRRVAVTYVVTGPYFESWAREATPSGIKDIAVSWFDVPAREAQVIEDGAGRIGFTSMPDVGKFVVAALRHPDEATTTPGKGGGGKALRVQSFVATPNEVVAEYERQTGGAPWKVSYVSLADVRAGEARLWAEDHPKATVVTLRRIWAEGGTLYDTTDNEAIGVRAGETETMDEVLRRLL